MQNILKRANIILYIVLTLCIATAFTCITYADSSGETQVYYEATLKTSSLGNYEITVKAYERPSHEVLPIISVDYFPTSESKYKTEIDNTEPSATYKANTVSKVDVVFAVGELSQSQALQSYIPTFTNLIGSSSNNIDAHVEQVETSSIDITSQDPSIILNTWQAWKQYDRDPTTTWSYIPSDRAIQDNEYHCHRQGYRDKVNSTEGDFVLEADIVGYSHSYNDFYGLTFRHSDFGAHYAIVWQDTQGSRCGMYSDQLYQGLSLIKATGNDQGRAVATKAIGAWKRGEYWNLRVEMTGNQIDIYINDIKQISWVDSSPYTTGTYGVVSVSHGSGRFKNIQITTGGTKTLGEAISNVAWRDGATRFVVHATDIVPVDCLVGEEDKFSYTVTKLLNSNAYLINLGNNVNRSQLDRLLKSITQADGVPKGIYYNNNPIITAMNNSAEYIINIAKNLAKPTDWVLVNTDILWNTEYKDNERDVPLNFGEHDGTRKQPQDKSDITIASSWGIPLTHLYNSDKSLAEKWRYKHAPTFYDNSNIQAGFNDIWIIDPIEGFENPGKYRINYKRRDNPLNPNVSLADAFDSYRYWSTDYDRED